ncbi:MAG: T9SS type A sorting domain-containing protein [Cyclobacteriaceae bacterium]
MKRTITFALSILISVTGYSQTGPGGIGSNDGTSTLELWVDANNGISGAAPITGWSDLSGNGIINTILGNPNINIGALNGYNAITFDGSGDYISTSLDISGGSFSQLEVFAVYSLTGTSGAVWGEDNGGYDRFLVDANGAGGCNFAVSNGTGCTNSATLFPTSTPTITSIHFQEDVISGSTAIVNGQTVFNFSSDHEVETSNLFDIGSIGSGSFAFNGDIAEVFVFGSFTNTAQRVIIHNYLSAKYNIALNAVDVYSEDDAINGNFDNEVAGIGRVNASNIHNDARGTGIVRILNPSGLGDNEFLMWGHDNGTQKATETTDIPAGVQARLDRVWRASEVNTSGTAVDVGAINIRFDLAGLGTITSSDLRLLVDTDNDGVFIDETPISGATSLGSSIYQFAGVTAIANNSRFTLGTINTIQTPLPIELVSFSAKLLDKKLVKLDWQTATEVNNDYFTIERSQNGSDWQVMSRVNGAGNSSSFLTYSIIDSKPYFGISYYRLKQTDFDGQFEYSQISSVNIERSNNSLVEIYPNPIIDQIAIVGSSSELEEVIIYNMYGKNVTVLTQLIENNGTQLIVDVTKLSTGIYYIKTKTTANKMYKQ